MKKFLIYLFSILIVFLHGIPTGFAINTDLTEFSYSINENYYLNFELLGKVDTNEYIRIKIISRESNKFSHNYIEIREELSFIMLLRGEFENLGGTGNYLIEFSGCSGEISDIINRGHEYTETDPYCKALFATKKIFYERPSLEKIVLPSAPIAGYEDNVITSFNNFNKVFSDVDKNTIEGISSLELFRRNIIGGYPDGTFKGSNEVNRAEAAKFLTLSRWGLFNIEINQDPFFDVPKSTWFAPYVRRAVLENIINGYPDGEFKPANKINTAEFIKMLSLTFDLELNLPYSYTDVPFNIWFSKYAGITEQLDLFPNRGEKLMPGKYLSRDEIAVAIYKFLQSRDANLSSGAIMLRDLFNNLDNDLCNNTTVTNLLEPCNDFGKEMILLRQKFVNNWINEETDGENDGEEFWAGNLEMTLFITEKTNPVLSDSPGQDDIEIKDSEERNITLFLAWGDKRSEFSNIKKTVAEKYNNEYKFFIGEKLIDPVKKQIFDDFSKLGLNYTEISNIDSTLSMIASALEQNEEVIVIGFEENELPEALRNQVVLLDPPIEYFEEIRVVRLYEELSQLRAINIIDLLNEIYDSQDLPFNVLKTTAISYSYDGGYYYGPGYIAYEWTGAGDQKDGYYGLRMSDYAQTDPYSNYTPLFHIFGSEYNKTKHILKNPIGVLHYSVNNVHNFVDKNNLRNESMLYFKDGIIQ